MSIATQISNVANDSRGLTAPGRKFRPSRTFRGLLAPGYCSIGSLARGSGFLAVVLVIFFCCALARAETPLYEEEPYDQITLNAANNNEVLKVKPLDPAIRNRTDWRRSEGKLLVHRLIDPDKEYEVLWRNIAKVELFEQLVLDKANELVEEGRFDEAYDYFTYLQRNKPALPGLAKAGEDCLFAEANAAYHKGQYDGALALLRELYRRNPKRPGLDRVLGGTTDKLVEQYVSEKNYPAARALLHNLAVTFPDNPVVARWNERWRSESAPLLAEARQAAESGQWGKAATLSRQVTALCPELPGARELAKTIHQKYSRLVVGVTAPATDLTVCRLDDWASRRARRLVYRTLTEFAGPSTEGGKYDCPVGKIVSQTLGRRLTINLRPDIHWAQGNATLTGVDVARLLLATADPSNPAYRVDWSDLMTAVSVRGVYGVEVELRRSHVHPEAMLQIILTPPGAARGPGQQPPANGPMVIQPPTSQETVFTPNLQYFAAEAGRPMELVEHRFDTVAQAVAALKRDDVQVVDRLNPWTLPSLRADPHLAVQSYSMPLVHCLIPNARRLLLGDRTFRRALAYGIQRQAILQQMLAGEDVPGCVVTSSPFPLGIGTGDPMGYASDESIVPRPYDPQLCIALASVAFQNYLDAQAAQKAGQKPEEKKEQQTAKKTEPKPDDKKEPGNRTRRRKRRRPRGPPCRN